jgi:hypothetical protein
VSRKVLEHDRGHWRRSDGEPLDERVNRRVVEVLQKALGGPFTVECRA